MSSRRSKDPYLCHTHDRARRTIATDTTASITATLLGITGFITATGQWPEAIELWLIGTTAALLIGGILGLRSVLRRAIGWMEDTVECSACDDAEKQAESTVDR